MENLNRDRKPDPALQSALFDYERSLARLGGDPGLFVEIVTLFLEDSPELLEQARRALNARDLEVLGRSAHSLKNLSANFDADGLTAAAAALEQHADDGEWARLAVCFAEMERELGRLQAALVSCRETGDGR
jgi:HPt (histidine-containing phosphotransfer) domain-containing protein